ncbi:TPA: nuclear transport factor 2 family protein [Mannheimia haemolytica]|uniref:SnoaL-like domain-containing protein n=1 Tax=Mannheimia haemolytica TaxID=75985 RepID=A0A378NCB4_MANHA|nr:nuclear transport factor 2 family protein [Mannheimia haemolytica]AGQ37686.1 bile acid 7-alpha-dehydratase [Mannheimia haemolytica D171]AJE08190.1 nuclear transport factor 2 family protein [Mannheimia haemolytica USDA-ARS-USMARC-184]EEY10988.1 bile acid 7-alpha-dehydratase [Mannheimia haemolytica serotype A2 str. OVINE]EEY13422.1 bile acid 7-alpha-dehydratase [Mannheimia haemolytica serotype A2 str. BOVINE]KYL17512.1 bile acid 7-alpha dehydratase [Mannheimia haemolytica]
MNLQQIQDRLALKDLVDTFSNLADEKKVAEQMPLFTQDAVVNTYIGGKLVFEMHGVAEIEQVFTTFLTPFHSVYHLNGQHTVTFIDENNATAINYCAVKLVETKEGKEILHDHSVRYADTYVKQEGKWRIAKRIANFMISESREIRQ